MGYCLLSWAALKFCRFIDDTLAMKSALIALLMMISSLNGFAQIEPGGGNLARVENKEIFTEIDYALIQKSVDGFIAYLKNREADCSKRGKSKGKKVVEGNDLRSIYLKLSYYRFIQLQDKEKCGDRDRFFSCLSDRDYLSQFARINHPRHLAFYLRVKNPRIKNSDKEAAAILKFFKKMGDESQK
jgi:hypothetical protein